MGRPPGLAIGKSCSRASPAQHRRKPRWRLLPFARATELRRPPRKSWRWTPGDSIHPNRWSKFLKPWSHFRRARNSAPARSAAQCISTRTLKNAASPPQPKSNLMEVSLPISAVNPPTPRPVATAPLLGAKAPSVTLPLIFTMTGLLALCAGIVWLVVQPSILATYHYNQNVIAATHLFVLGWICSVVMGAMYQLVPVALETKLYSEKLAACQDGFIEGRY